MIAQPHIIYEDVQFYGNSALVFDTITGRGPGHTGCIELLFEGPAGGGGKTRTDLEAIFHVCESEPGTRAIILRKVKADHAQSTLEIFENEVLPEDHYLKNQMGRKNRDSYLFKNGSEIIIAGFDNSERFRSSRYDIGLVVEASQCTEEDWEDLTSRIRNGKRGWHICIAETNPDAPKHWLNLRAKAGTMIRVKGRYEDNPFFYDQEKDEWTEDGDGYVNHTLMNLTGVRLQRLRYGRWAASDGMVWEDFDPEIHVIKARCEHDKKDGHWWISGGMLRRQVSYFFGAIDWGFTAAGVMQVWAVDNDMRAYLVHEVYRRKKTIDFWEKKCKELITKYGVRGWKGDPAEPESIEQFRRAGIPIVKANNAKKPGLDCVRDRLVPVDGRPPRIFLLADALESVCPISAMLKKPTCTIDEIPEYVYAKLRDGQIDKEKTDDGNEDHGCDTMRYAIIHLDYNDWRDKPKSPGFKKGTMGDVLDHASVYAKLGRPIPSN